MKNKILLLFFIFTYFSSISQTTISLNPSYVNQSFYSMANGEVANVSNNDWDIAFSLQSMGASIRTNDGMGVELYTYSAGDISSWSSINSTSTSMVNSPLYNSDTSWSGAFDNHQTSSMDLGWGIYSVFTHHVTGDSIHIIKTLNGNWKKLIIESLASGIYTFKYANLDGTNEVLQTIDKSNYSSKNYVYYSLDQDLVMDREPLSTDWDITFTKYIAQIPFQQSVMAYGVTGVLHNNGIEAIEVNNITNPNTYSNYTAHTFQTNINTIGYQWKSYDMSSSSYLIDPNTCFFIKDHSSNIYRIVFTAFGGSSNGDIQFNTQLVSTTSFEESSFVSAFSMYPNPSTNNVTITYETSSQYPEITICNLIGEKVYHEKLSSDIFAATTIPISHFKKGVYIVCISDENNHRLQEKLIIH